MESLFSFLASRSSAICSPMAFMSFLLSADVMYMCISRNRPGGEEERLVRLFLAAPLGRGNLTFRLLISLVHLKLGQQADEPLKGLLVPVDPDEVHLVGVQGTISGALTKQSAPAALFLTLRNFMSLSFMFSHQE